MKLKEFCKSYFNGFHNLHNYKENTRKKNGLALLSIVSYFSIIIPLGVAFAYGSLYLYKRISKKSSLTPNDVKTKKIASDKLKLEDSRSIKIDHLESEELKSEDIPSELNIRGNRCVDQSIIIDYFVHLSKTYSELFVPARNALYTVDLNLNQGDKVGIEEAVLYDGHYENGLCLHEEGVDCKKNIFAYPLLLAESHWCLVIVDRVKRTVEYYNSKIGYYYDPQPVKDCLTKLAATLSNKDPGNNPYQFQDKINVVLQEDSFQCAIWLLYFLENRLKKGDSFDFNKLDIQQAQQEIADFRNTVQKAVLKVERGKFYQIRRPDKRLGIETTPYTIKTMSDDAFYNLLLAANSDP